MQRTPLTTASVELRARGRDVGTKAATAVRPIMDSEGKPASSVSPEDVRVAENGVDAKVLKVEAIEWTTKVQILIDNGPGLGQGGLVPLRNGLRALLEALPPGLKRHLSRPRLSRGFSYAPQPTARRCSRVSTGSPRTPRPAGSWNHLAKRCSDSSGTRPTSSESSSRLGTTQGDNKVRTATSARYSIGAEEATTSTWSWCPPGLRRPVAASFSRTSGWPLRNKPVGDTKASTPPAAWRHCFRKSVAWSRAARGRAGNTALPPSVPAELRMRRPNSACLAGTARS